MKPKHIKTCIRELLQLTIYHAERVIRVEHKLETLLVHQLKQASTRKDLYMNILTTAKELNHLATAAILQDTHTRIATAYHFEATQRSLARLLDQLEGA